MKMEKLFLAFSFVSVLLVSISCNKLQDGYDYKSSFVENDLKMNVWDFMQSRKDAFSGMIAAIEYVSADSNYKDVKQMYFTTGNTFLLLHNNALINLEDGNSYWSRNLVSGPDPLNPSVTVLMKGTDWSQYSREEIANMLRYHVLKGNYTYSTLNSTPKWVETFASSPTNDSAKVYLYLENVREANLRINNYIGVPTVYKGQNIGSSWVNIAPRTPDLKASNGTVHVMNRFLFQPTRDAIRNN